MFQHILPDLLHGHSARPEKANEISGLMVTGIFGGAVIPPLMGYCTDLIGTQAGFTYRDSRLYVLLVILLGGN